MKLCRDGAETEWVLGRRDSGRVLFKISKKLALKSLYYTLLPFQAIHLLKNSKLLNISLYLNSTIEQTLKSRRTMRIAALFFTFILISTTNVFSQISFSDQTATLLGTDNHYSGCAMGIADMNGDGLDDIVRLNNAILLSIEYQQEDGTTFINGFSSFLIGGGSQWSLSIADVDSNGYNDILVGGAYNGLKLLKANDTGDNYLQELIPDPSIFLQGSNFVDIDHDGAIDIFACHDDGISAPFANDGFGEFSYDLGLINATSANPSDNSGNYGSIWTDYDNDGDIDLYLSKCRLGVSDPFDGRRMNLLYQNDGNGNFIEVAENAGLRPFAQSWAADFGDLDNDGDLDCIIINHDKPNQIYENNGDGTFTDVTTASGINDVEPSVFIGIQSIFDDFDNDGFLDLLITSNNRDNILFQNNGDFTFTPILDAFPTSLRMQSATVGDLNNDGKLDIYAGFANFFNSPSNDADILFINETVVDNHLSLQLKGQDNNLNALGARVEIYGPWGVQVREVRSGESYGITTSHGIHFGLGIETMVDSLIIRWPDGTLEVLCGIAANQSMTLEQEALPDLLTSGFTFTENNFEVSFSDTTQGIPTSWLWDFGDGQTSTEQNPIHTFPDNGPYTITLTASNDCESDVTSSEWSLLALPVDLVSFSAKLTADEKVAIKWTTENEFNFKHFELERTTDFRNIDRLTTVVGSQNFNTKNDYDWIDSNPSRGNNYYRLKQVDTDGQFEYSDWEVVEVSNGFDKIKVFPNPAVDKITIQMGLTDVQSVIGYMATGELFFIQENLPGSFELNIENWEVGVYYLKVTSSNGVEVVRFLKSE